jgi:hypothetical protein
MKTNILIILISICIALPIYGQTENPDSKNLTKQEKKALRKAKKEEEKRKYEENLIKFEQYAQMRAWVIEAQTVYDKQGNSFQMQPTTNFVFVNNEETTVQLSFAGLVGWNGVGGITLDGKVGKYEVTRDKNTVNINMSARGASIGNANIILSISGDSNGRATVTGNWGERIVFQGRFISLADSKIYKGTTTY